MRETISEIEKDQEIGNDLCRKLVSRLKEHGIDAVFDEGDIQDYASILIMRNVGRQVYTLTFCYSFGSFMVEENRGSQKIEHGN